MTHEDAVALIAALKAVQREIFYASFMICGVGCAIAIGLIKRR